MNRHVLLFFALLCCSILPAQENWTLSRAVDYALQNNILIQQADYAVRNAELNLLADQRSRLPNLNGSVSGGYQFGRTIDPTTNSFDNEAIFFNSYQLSTGVTLYSGGRVNNQIRQSQLNALATRLDSERTRNDIALAVANAYLNVLLNQEQLANARLQLQLTQQQLDNTAKLIRAGSLPANDSLNLVAQIASNERAVIELENAVAINLLSIKQLLQIDPATPFRISAPDLELDEALLVRNFSLEDVYLAALRSQPGVRAAETRVESAAVGEDLARAGLYPTLALFGSLSTNYSSLAKDFTSPDESNAMLVETPPQTVIIDNQQFQVSFLQLDGVVFPQKSFADQLTDNFGQSVGLSLQVPIYSNSRNRIAMQQAEISRLNSQTILEQERQQLRSDVQLAIADFRAGRETYLAARRSLQAAQAALDNTQRRYDLGAANTLDFLTAANQLDLARTELTRAKYQLLFNYKVVQFYLGENLTLD